MTFHVPTFRERRRLLIAAGVSKINCGVRTFRIAWPEWVGRAIAGQPVNMVKCRKQVTCCISQQMIKIFHVGPYGPGVVYTYISIYYLTYFLGAGGAVRFLVVGTISCSEERPPRGQL